MMQADIGPPAVTEGSLALAVTTPLPGVLLLEVSGELDLLTKPPLIECVDDVLHSQPNHFVLDMSGVSFMGASGLQAIVFAKDRSDQCDIDLHISGATHREVAKPLEILCLNQVLTMHETWKDAMEAIA